MKTNVILFDLDGTLIDSRMDVVHSVEAMLRQLKLPPVDRDLIFRYVGPGVKPLVRAVLGDRQDLFDDGVRTINDFYSKHLLDNTRLYDGILDVLKKIQNKKLGVITNKPQAHADAILKGLTIDHYFSIVLGAEACTKQKPDPEPIFKAMKLLGGKPQSTIIVGDTDIDITAGKRAGIKTCGVLYGFGTAESLTKAKPDYLVHSPRELEEIFF